MSITTRSFVVLVLLLFALGACAPKGKVTSSKIIEEPNHTARDVIDQFLLVQIETDDGVTVSTKDPSAYESAPRGEAALKVPLEKVLPGTHELAIELARNNKTTILKHTFVRPPGLVIASGSNDTYFKPRGLDCYPSIGPAMSGPSGIRVSYDRCGDMTLALAGRPIKNGTVLPFADVLGPQPLTELSGFGFAPTVEVAITYAGANVSGKGALGGKWHFEIAKYVETITAGPLQLGKDGRADAKPAKILASLNGLRTMVIGEPTWDTVDVVAVVKDSLAQARTLTCGPYTNKDGVAEMMTMRSLPAAVVFYDPRTGAKLREAMIEPEPVHACPKLKRAGESGRATELSPEAIRAWFVANN